jgi:hypothetical protein
MAYSTRRKLKFIVKRWLQAAAKANEEDRQASVRSLFFKKWI